MCHTKALEVCSPTAQIQAEIKARLLQRLPCRRTSGHHQVYNLKYFKVCIQIIIKFHSGRLLDVLE